MVGDPLELVLRLRVGEQVTEAEAIVAVADPLLERPGRTVGREQALDVIHVQLGRRGELTARRFPPLLLHVGTARRGQTRQGAPRAIRQHDRPIELGRHLLHRLPDPP